MHQEGVTAAGCRCRTLRRAPGAARRPGFAVKSGAQGRRLRRRTPRRGCRGGADGRRRGRDAGPSSARQRRASAGLEEPKAVRPRGGAPLGALTPQPLGIERKVLNPCKAGRFRQRKEARTAKHTTCIAHDTAYIPPHAAGGGCETGSIGGIRLIISGLQKG